MHRDKLFTTRCVSQCNNNYSRIIITVQSMTVVKISAVATFHSKWEMALSEILVKKKFHLF